MPIKDAIVGNVVFGQDGLPRSPRQTSYLSPDVKASIDVLDDGPLTLRDRFAIAALPALIGRALEVVAEMPKPCQLSADDLAASMAYSFADALIAERAKRGGR